MHKTFEKFTLSEELLLFAIHLREFFLISATVVMFYWLPIIVALVNLGKWRKIAVNAMLEICCCHEASSVG